MIWYIYIYVHTYDDILYMYCIYVYTYIIIYLYSMLFFVFNSMYKYIWIYIYIMLKILIFFLNSISYHILPTVGRLIINRYIVWFITKIGEYDQVWYRLVMWWNALEHCDHIHGCPRSVSIFKLFCQYMSIHWASPISLVAWSAESDRVLILYGTNREALVQKQ